VEEMLRLTRACGNPWTLALAMTNVGRLEMIAGRWAEAYPLLEQSAALFAKIRDRSMYTAARSEMGHLYRRQGLHAEAAAIYRDTIRTFQELGQQPAVAHHLESFAFIAAAQSQPVRAATLLGAAEAVRERIKSGMTPMERREYARFVDDLRALPNQDAISKAWAEGRGLTMEEAIQFALS
jgi:hypothetical protein